jgi:hypothetical protein
VPSQATKSLIINRRRCGERPQLTGGYFMSQQPNDETKNQTTSVTPGQSETIRKGEKVNNDLLEDELSQISGGLKPHPDSY